MDCVRLPCDYFLLVPVSMLLLLRAVSLRLPVLGCWDFAVCCPALCGPLKIRLLSMAPLAQAMCPALFCIGRRTHSQENASAKKAQATGSGRATASARGSPSSKYGEQLWVSWPHHDEGGRDLHVSLFGPLVPVLPQLRQPPGHINLREW